MDDERAALIAGIQRQIAAITRHRATQQRPLAPLPPPPQRRGATGILDALLHVLLMLCVLAFLVICWRLLGDYRATPSNRDTAFVVVALFVAGALFGWLGAGDAAVGVLLARVMGRLGRRTGLPVIAR